MKVKGALETYDPLSAPLSSVMAASISTCSVAAIALAHNFFIAHPVSGSLQNNFVAKRNRQGVPHGKAFSGALPRSGKLQC
jgi:hypothetical protein